MKIINTSYNNSWQEFAVCIECRRPDGFVLCTCCPKCGSNKFVRKIGQTHHSYREERKWYSIAQYHTMITKFKDGTEYIWCENEFVEPILD